MSVLKLFTILFICSLLILMSILFGADYYHIEYQDLAWQLKFTLGASFGVLLASTVVICVEVINKTK